MLIEYSRDKKEWKEYLVTGLGIAELLVPEPAALVINVIKELLADDPQAKSEALLEQGFGSLIASSQEMNAIMHQGLATVAYQLALVYNNIDSLPNHLKQEMARLSSDIDRLRSDVNQVGNNIQSLHADFNWGIGALLWQIEMQQKTMQTILETLQTPLDVQAKELRRRAEFAYHQGWYQEALKDFLESEEKNYQDFTVHQAIGNIYLYHEQPINLSQARAYYLKAAKYAKPHSVYHSALAYMHAGFVCYLQRDDKAAIENTYRAIEIYPELTEAFYNHAKFAAASHQVDVAIPSLEKAICANRNYAIKARTDADFENIETAVADLIERLRVEAQQKVESQWQPLQVDLQRYALPSGKKSNEINRLRSEVETLIEQNTYFCYLDAPAKIGECRALFESLRLPERYRLRDEATEQLARLRSEMAQYAMSNRLKSQLTSKLLKPEKVLAGIPTHENAKWAVDAIKWYEQQWKNILVTGQARTVLQGHYNAVLSIAFSPDGTILACGLQDGTVWLWKVDHSGAQPTPTTPNHSLNPMIFVPDNTPHNTTLRELTVFTWNGINNQPAVLQGHTGPISALAFSSGGKRLASGSYDSSISLWDTSNWRRPAILIGHSGYIYATAFSSPSYTIATASGDHTIRLWDVLSGQLRAILIGHTNFVNAIAFSPTSSMLASGSADNTVRLWTLGREYELKGHTNWVNTVAFSPDGKTLASGSSDNTIRVWNVESRQTLMVLTGHIFQVLDLAFSPDGRTLASASVDHTVQLWDTVTGRRKAVLKGHTGSVTSVAFSKDGTLLASGSLDRTVRVWNWVVRKSN